MRCFCSHLKKIIFVIGIIFLNQFFYLAFAEDIEIDLGGSQTPTAKSSVSTNNKQQTPLTNQKASVGNSAANNEQPTDVATGEESALRLASVVNQVSVSSAEGGARVSIKGTNLPVPQIKKLSKQKMLIKLSKTKLKISSNIKGDNQVVKNIRSSVHSGNTAWIVLDVAGVKKWDVEKTDEGYLLTLSSSEVSNRKPGVVAKENPASASEDLTEKKLFSRLIDVSFKSTEKGTKIVLTSDGPSKYTVRKLIQPDKLVMRFHNTKLEVVEKLRKFSNFEPEFQKGGIISLELRQIGPLFSPISEAVLALMPGTIHQIDRDLNQVVITLMAPPVVEKSVEKKGNLNQLVSLDIEGADLNAVVKTLAGEAGFNVDLISGPLSGVVNEKFKDIPLKTALATLLSTGGYDFEVQGNTLAIGLTSTLAGRKANMPHITEILSPSGGMAPSQFDTLVKAILKPTNAVKVTPDTVRNVLILNGTPTDIEDYKRAIKDLKLDESSNSDRVTRIVKLNYADPLVISGILTAYLTPVGKVQTKGETLIVWETASNMGVLLELIKELDRKPAQVLIESNIVEIDDEKDLGVGINWSATRNVGDPTISTSYSPQVPPGGFPANFTFGTIKSGLNIGATLQALETHKKGKIISRPRIATASGIQAEIQTTENVIVSTTQQIVLPGGNIQTTTTFTSLPLPIDLKVTPRITDDGRITTIVNAQITSQTGNAAGAGQPPPTSQQSATTTITTKNGETIVIGGLVRETVQDTVNGIPLLSSLPIIGTLFQEHDKTNRKVELVIFITPTLLED